MTVTEKIGQRLVGGFPGTEMDGEFIRLVREYKGTSDLISPTLQGKNMV